METGIITAAVGALGGFVAYLRSKRGKAQASTILRRLFNIDPSADDLRVAMENMSAVVDAQGQSITWLTEQQASLIEQLAAAKVDLEEAREKLKEMEDIHRQNMSLRIRVAELEEQVKALETELARRKKYTRKDLRGE
jgi:multidrug resistance efflux pump